MDAFEKLLRLGLNNQQEREIIHVIVDVTLQEKTFNPYYAYLLQKFCEYDRRFQVINTDNLQAWVVVLYHVTCLTRLYKFPWHL